MLISLHLPKTAGSSFGAALKEYYGSRIYIDHRDKPINTPHLKRKLHALKSCAMNSFQEIQFDCIHGHFLPFKYALCTNATFVTWLRDPVERLASHYYYWLRTYNPETASILRKKVVEDEWSLERFCLCPELKNLYSQYLWGFSLRRFKFIGVTEFFNADIDYVSNRVIGGALNAYRKRANAAKASSAYIISGSLRDRIEEYHDKDVALYNLALKLRERRLSV
jgi:hypothetical protein